MIVKLNYLLQMQGCYLIDPGCTPYTVLVWMSRYMQLEARRKCIRAANVTATDRSPVSFSNGLSRTYLIVLEMNYAQ